MKNKEKYSNTTYDEYLGKYEFIDKNNVCYIYQVFYEYGSGSNSLFRVRWGREKAPKKQVISVNCSELNKVFFKKIYGKYKLVNIDKENILWSEFEKNQILNSISEIIVDKENNSASLNERKRKM